MIFDGIFEHRLHADEVPQSLASWRSHNCSEGSKSSCCRRLIELFLCYPESTSSGCMRCRIDHLTAHALHFSVVVRKRNNEHGCGVNGYMTKW
jgi:hypothetical protein